MKTIVKKEGIKCGGEGGCGYAWVPRGKPGYRRCPKCFKIVVHSLDGRTT